MIKRWDTNNNNKEIKIKAIEHIELENNTMPVNS